MRKPARFFFFLLLLVACFQFAGVEEAFCEDSAAEAACESCFTCAGHPFAGLCESIILPSITLFGYSTPSDFFPILDQPPVSFLRPPISLS